MFQFVFNFLIAIGILPIFIHPTKIFFLFFDKLEFFLFFVKRRLLHAWRAQSSQRIQKKLQQIMYRRTDFKNNGMESLDMKP